MTARLATDGRWPSSGLLSWLGNAFPGIAPSAPEPEPAVTRAEIAQWLARSIADDLRRALRTLGRPGMVVVRCRFPGFQDDLRAGLKELLGEGAPCDVLSAWPSDADEARVAAKATIDALNAGRARVFVLPHERVLNGLLPHVDAVLKLPRFNAAGLAEACRQFYELTNKPDVPNEPWVGLVSPSDLLISSAVAGDPITAIRDATRRRLREHDCSDAAPLESLLGMNEVRAWADTLIEDIRDAMDPQIRCRWEDIERAVVVVGPRGSGKASLSRAIARAAGLQWIKVSASRWTRALETERWQSSDEHRASIAAMEADFDAARQLAPAILFIEDLDELSPELASPLGRMIAENDSTDPVLVIGSAIDDAVLDQDMLRTAHFEHTVYLPLPNANVLVGALQVRLREVPHTLGDAQIRQIARLALGGTAADLDLYMRRAQKLARRAGGRPVGFDDLAAAILETPSVTARPTVSEAELSVTAYHEAGHAVMQFLENGGGKEIQFLTVIPRRLGDGMALGFLLRAPEIERHSLSRTEGLAMIRGLLGGRAAEELLLGREQISTGSGGSADSDLAKATRVAAWLIGRCGMGDSGSLVYRPGKVESDAVLDRQVDALLRKQYRLTVRLMRTHWAMVTTLAAHLLAQLELSGDEVRAVLMGTSRNRP